MTSRWKLALIALCSMVALTLGTVPAAADSASRPSDHPLVGGTPDHATMLGDFAAPIWEPEADAKGAKVIDTKATLDALQAAHINTYAYIISGGAQYGDGKASPEVITQDQWERFPAFAAAAARRNIDVYLYISPPSENAGPRSEPRPEQHATNMPFGWNYVKWAEETAKLAVTYPNIGGLFIDDFDPNTEFEKSPYSFVFTPEYVKQMSAAAKSHDPDFKIYGIVYYRHIDTAAAFRGALDGIVFPYRSATSVRGTSDPSKVRSEGEIYGDISHCFSGDLCLQFSADASAQDEAASATRSVSVQPGSHTLRMQVNQDNYAATCPDGACYEFRLPGYTPTQSGDNIAISQQVRMTRGGSHTLSFWTGALHSTLSGYHVLQALVNGQVVASRDIYSAAGPKKFTVDVTEAIGDADSAKLTFRLEDVKGVTNYGTDFYLDDVELTGATVKDGSFDTPDSDDWTRSQVGDQMSAGYTAGAYVLDVLVNDKTEASVPLKGYQGWSPVQADLTKALAGIHSAKISVRLRALGSDLGLARHVWVDDLSISGTSATDSNFDDVERWSFTSDEHVSVQQVKSFDTIFMLYASRLSSDPAGHQPSVDYIRQVQTAGLEMMREGYFDGSLIYVLNLSSPIDSTAGAERGVIEELYGDYAATDLAACDETITGSRHGLQVDDGRVCLVHADVSGATRVAKGAELVAIDSTLHGSLSVRGSIAACGSSVTGSVQIASATDVRLGATPGLCAGDQLRGSTQITGTSGIFTIANTTVKGTLACSGNTSIPHTRDTSNTIKGSATGQCAGI